LLAVKQGSFACYGASRWATPNPNHDIGTPPVGILYADHPSRRSGFASTHCISACHVPPSCASLPERVIICLYERNAIEGSLLAGLRRADIFNVGNARTGGAMSALQQSKLLTWAALDIRWPFCSLQRSRIERSACLGAAPSLPTPPEYGGCLAPHQTGSIARRI
jgi:hypothetical protein